MPRLPLIIAACLAVATLGGCASGELAPLSTVRPVTVATVTPAAAADLTAVTDPKLGRLVADQNGMTVYFINTDPTKPPASNCLGDCVKLWPPILLPSSGSASVKGIDPNLVGTFTRPDRGIQLTLAGHPLYRFSGDTPGTTQGHDLAGTVFAITPSGTRPPVRGRV